MEITEYVRDQLAKYQGISFPVKSSILRRLFIKKLHWKKMHPNPDDPFTNPDVGPSERIISDYKNKLLKNNSELEPIVLEKMHPDGYLIMNGHHRWAAAMMLDIKRIPVRIVNLTHEDDIKRMLRNAKHDKRVAIDLDEVIFTADSDGSYEDSLPFPFSITFKERIRSGIPALFNYLKKNGYDIWVYSANDYSFDHIHRLFKLYHVSVDGVVTGMHRLSKGKEANPIQVLLTSKYKYTLNIDNNSVLKIYNQTGSFIEKEIHTEDSNWSAQVMAIVGELHEEK